MSRISPRLEPGEEPGKGHIVGRGIGEKLALLEGRLQQVLQRACVSRGLLNGQLLMGLSEGVAMISSTPTALARHSALVARTPSTGECLAYLLRELAHVHKLPQR